MEIQHSTSPSEPILIVDDNPNNLKVLSQALRSAGWTVAVAKNGETALKQVKHTPPALILLDVMMPEMDGFEACQRLKANPETMDIPVIFMTALAETVDKVKGLSLGAVDYITKPFQMEEVLARLNIHYKLCAVTHELEMQNQQLEQRVKNRTAELEESLKDLQQAQLQLIQHEKMATLGQLLSGIAHEINNPIGFIGGNVSVARGYIQDLLQALQLYQAKFPDPGAEFEQQLEALNLGFIIEDIPKLIESMQAGVERICNISTSLRIFSRTDTKTKVDFNIHEGIDSTLMILKHQLKATDHRPEIELIKDYGELPQVKCFPGQLNQVFMNIIANAIDALEEKNQGCSFNEIETNPNQITFRTEVDEGNGQIIIRIADNGVGMVTEVKDKIFDSLFTTKAVGKGTGLGLSISRQIVEENHGGKLTCFSKIGEGTEFVLALPLS